MDVSTCDTCPGFGVTDLVVGPSSSVLSTTNSYQVLGFLPNTCPGRYITDTDNFDNVTVDLVDGYAGVAYLGGAMVTTPHDVVVYYNTEMGPNIRSYFAAYVDYSAFATRMVEIHLTISDGKLSLCAPEAKTYEGVPDLLNSGNVINFWNQAEPINVASCVKCAGYGITFFRFGVEQALPPTPLPTMSPIAPPTEQPSMEPTVEPTDRPTDLPPGQAFAPDEADGTIDGKPSIVTIPIASPTREPFTEPTFAPIPGPTFFPVASPTQEPSMEPTESSPTAAPIEHEPSEEPTKLPIAEPTLEPVTPPTFYPVNNPTKEPVATPTLEPSAEPSMGSTIILGRPCDVSDDYVDQGGPTIDGVPIPQV